MMIRYPMAVKYPHIVVIAAFAYAMGFVFGSIVMKKTNESSHVCSCEGE